MRNMIRQLFAAGMVFGMFALAGCTDGEVECPDQNLICGGVCTPVLSDTNNCGGCGNSCSSGFECVEGACLAPECVAGTEFCGSGCVDTTTNRDHCGGCGLACDTGEACEEGACAAIVCEDEAALCGNDCVDLDTDRRNCGSCGNACDSNQACEAGGCVEIPCEGEDCEEAAAAVFAACFQAGTVTSFDTETLTAGTKKATGIDGPQAMAILDDEHFLVAGGMDVTLYVFHRETMAKVGTTALGAWPENVVVRNQKAYIINSGFNTVQVVDLSNPAAPRSTDEVNTGEGTNPMMGAFDSNQTFWISLYETAQLIPVDFSGAEGKVGDPVDLPRAEGNPRPSGVVVLDGVAYVALNNLAPNYNPAGNGRIATVDLGDRSTGMIDLGETCVNPGTIKQMGSLLAVTCTGWYSSDPEHMDGEVVLVDPATNTVTQRFHTGGNPVPIAADKVAGKLFVGDTSSVEFMVIDVTSGNVENVSVCDPTALEFVSDIVIGN